MIKAWHGYHGSYDDLEVGLQGQGEIPGRVALATFGDLDSYRAALERNRGEVAAIVVEPVQYTGVVTPPPDGFLAALRELAREAGVLFVLDDCLMFRLAEGGSAERFGVEAADITCLGKWIGGGLPVGAVTASDRADGDLRPQPRGRGRLLPRRLLQRQPARDGRRRDRGRDLTAADIARIDAQGDELRADIARRRRGSACPSYTQGLGSAFGLYVLDGTGAGPEKIDFEATSLLHLAAVNHGVYYGTGGEFGLCTALDDGDLEDVRVGLRAALSDVAQLAQKRE